MSTIVDVSSKKVQSQPSPNRDSEMLFEPPTDKYLRLLRRDEAEAEAYLSQVEQRAEVYSSQAKQWVASMRAQYLKEE